MIFVALGLILVAIAGSAFFSGSETGFYRATRLRLVVDALAGQRTARGLLWLNAHPGLFVTTMLVGTNLAHYLASLALVLGTEDLGPLSTEVMAFVGPLALAPFLFVLGELAPKSLFLDAPNRLLRRVGPLLLLSTVLLFPIAALLWGVSRLFGRWLGQSSHDVQSALARLHLRETLEEGHAAGVLFPAQRTLAQGILSAAQEPLRQFLQPLARWPHATAEVSRSTALRLAQQRRATALLVEERRPEGVRPVGYVRTIELWLGLDERLPTPHPLPRLAAEMPHLEALVQLQAAEEELALVVDRRGVALGIIAAEQLREAMFLAKC